MKLRATLVLALAVAWAALAGPAASADAYPPKICPTVSVSTTTPLVGESIVVSGTAFDPNASIRIEMRPKDRVLASVKSDANGTFKTRVTLPTGVVGSFEIFAVGGGADAGCAADPVQIGASHGTDGESPSNGGGGTAFTGVDVLLLVFAAALLLAAGFLVNRGGRRRSTHVGEY